MTDVYGDCYMTIVETISVKKKEVRLIYTTYIYFMLMYKQDPALNNLQWLICH